MMNPSSDDLRDAQRRTAREWAIPEDQAPETIQRPDGLLSQTFDVMIPVDGDDPVRSYFTVVFLDGQPFEVFCYVGKVGNGSFARGEEVGRLTSLLLRRRTPVMEIVDQLRGITGSATVWHKGVLVRSVGDAVASILALYDTQKKGGVASATPQD